MPIPRAIAKANRAGLNRITRRFAGRIPPFVVVSHTGRRSGKHYTVPLMAFRPADHHDERFIIALTYGENTDWQKNIQAGGPASITTRGRTYTIDTLRTGARRDLPTGIPWFVQRFLDLIGADRVAVIDCSPRGSHDKAT